MTMETECELLFFDTFSHDSCEVRENQVKSNVCLSSSYRKIDSIFFFHIIIGVEPGPCSVSTTSLHF